MHLYDSRVGEFIPYATSGQIADRLRRNFVRQFGHNVGDSEVRSWHNSLGAFADSINDVGMDEAWIVLEYQLPLSSARVDCMVLGSDPDKQQNAVLLEFKQWDRCEATKVPGVVRLDRDEKLHPSAQVMAYRKYLEDAHAAFADGKIGLHSAAFMHNLRNKPGSNIYASQYAKLIEDSPVFSAHDVEDLTRYVGEKTGCGADSTLVNAVLRGDFKPSKTLLANVAKAIQGHRPWQLLDNQLLIFRRIADAVRAAQENGERATIIVSGGPGTGKSIIATQLVGSVAKLKKYSVVHATGSKAFTTNMRGAVGKAASSVFKYTSDFAKAPAAGLDLIVVDEAHRLREQTTNFFGKVVDPCPQWQRITDASKVAVYFLDERQQVKLGEAGTIQNIRSYSEEVGIPVLEYPLDTQFRCAGSESYIRWVEHALALSPENSLAWKENKEYEVVIHDRVRDLEAAMRRKAGQGRTARLVAGFCWEWSNPRKDNTLVPDVKIDSEGWAMPWNRKAEGSPPPERHPYTIWATKSEGIDEVGCIYSAQGFEFDYIGVIWGPDLRWDPRQGRWVADLKASKDTGWKRGLSDQPDLAVEQLQHIYRVLATRGMKGAHFYFVDQSTRKYIQSLLI